MIEQPKNWSQRGTCLWISVLLIACPASAQHSDVLFFVEGDQIVVPDLFYADSIRSFDVLGDGTVWHGSNPGYSTSKPGQFNLQDEVGFGVVSPLLFSVDQSWDVATDDLYVRQFWPVFPELSVTTSAATGNQSGFLIESVGNRGTVHQHHTFELASFSRTVPPIGAYAVQQVISADGYLSSNPFWIVWNNGLPVAEFAASLRTLPPIDIVGDYDRNGILDVRDINRLREQVFVSAEVTDLAAEFDLTGDVRIDSKDLEFWVRDVRRTWIGDANLDGEFNSTDLIQAFGFGHYEDQIPERSLWQHGDWNGDGEFASGDLIAAFQDGGYELGPRPVAADAVPEPVGTGAVLFALFAFIVRLRHVIERRQSMKRAFERTPDTLITLEFRHAQS